MLSDVKLCMMVIHIEFCPLIPLSLLSDVKLCMMVIHIELYPLIPPLVLSDGNTHWVLPIQTTFNAVHIELCPFTPLQCCLMVIHTELCPFRPLSMLSDGNTHWAMPIHTTFNNLKLLKFEVCMFGWIFIQSSSNFVWFVEYIDLLMLLLTCTLCSNV